MHRLVLLRDLLLLNPLRLLRTPVLFLRDLAMVVVFDEGHCLCHIFIQTGLFVRIELLVQPLLGGEQINQRDEELLVAIRVQIVDRGELLGDPCGQVSEQVDSVIQRVTRDDLVAVRRRHEV